MINYYDILFIVSLFVGTELYLDMFLSWMNQAKGVQS